MVKNVNECKNIIAQFGSALYNLVGFKFTTASVVCIMATSYLSPQIYDLSYIPLQSINQSINDESMNQ